MAFIAHQSTRAEGVHDNMIGTVFLNKDSNERMGMAC